MEMRTERLVLLILRLDSDMWGYGVEFQDMCVFTNIHTHCNFVDMAHYRCLVRCSIFYADVFDDVGRLLYGSATQLSESIWGRLSFVG
jgi:hypothetical protein